MRVEDLIRAPGNEKARRDGRAFLRKILSLLQRTAALAPTGAKDLKGPNRLLEAYL